MGNIKNEHGYQALAFEEYYALRAKGVARDDIFKIIAPKYHKSVMTVRSWYVKFNWPGRANTRDVSIRKKAMDTAEETLVDIMGKQKQIIRATVARYVEQLRRKKVKVTPADIKRILEHELILYGWTPSYGLTHGANDELKELLENMKNILDNKEKPRE